MEVLILSKTHMGPHLACVGGITLQGLKPVRLHNGINGYQPANTEFEVGQVWDIDFKPHPDKPPHFEDVIVNTKKLVSAHFDIASFVRTKCPIWQGNPQVLFDGTLQWTNNDSGFVNSTAVPQNSVGFWICDKDLTYENGHYLYPRRLFRQKRLKYVGYEDAKGIIPAGTIIRVSLAKWWHPRDVDIELRCYLQLSGWY